MTRLYAQHHSPLESHTAGKTRRGGQPIPPLSRRRRRRGVGASSNSSSSSSWSQAAVSPGERGGLGLHAVLPRTISAPSARRRRWWHSTPASGGAASAQRALTPVRDCSTLSLPHSRRYSRVNSQSSWSSRIGIGTLCKWETPRRDKDNGE